MLQIGEQGHIRMTCEVPSVHTVITAEHQTQHVKHAKGTAPTTTAHRIAIATRDIIQHLFQHQHKQHQQ